MKNEEEATQSRGKKGASSVGVRSGPAERALESDLLKDSLAYTIKRSQLRADAALVKYLDYAISPARLGALATIGANPGISQAALSAHLDIAGPSVVKVIDELEKRRLVQRKPGPNRRRYALQLTPTGEKQLRRYADSVKAFETGLALAFTKAELQQLFSLLARVAPDES